MNQPNRCPQCGATLTDIELSGLCPQCLLAVGMEEPSNVGQDNATATKMNCWDDYEPPTPAALNELLPAFEFIEMIGAGGMGVVYKAKQRSLDRLVAIKILPASIRLDPTFTERFSREARALGRLSHPNIVGIYDTGVVGDLYYIVMEFVDGANLRQLLSQSTFAPKNALAIIPQLCDALQYAHDEGFVHRDIKPENILLDRRGRVKIADFGLAKLLGINAEQANLTATNQVMGTVKYMAPEQMEGVKDND